MQLLTIRPDTTLKSLGLQVGSRNLDTVLSANTLTRTPNIGQAFIDRSNQIIEGVVEDVHYIKKMSILNTLTSDADIFELAALANDREWKLLSAIGTLPGMLKIPEEITLPDSADIVGNGIPLTRTVYDKAMQYLLKDPHYLDPSIFNEFSTVESSKAALTYIPDSLSWFHLPWGKISLFSSLAGSSIDFPVYPTTLSDGVKANYDTMPDMLYQYEPWQIYKSSGPRSNTYEFHMHRDMWSGNHLDGKCNELIRFCQANCYPEYKGASVHTSNCTLYISGKPLISGIITDVSTDWAGPLGLDDFWLEVTLKLSITEISDTPLGYSKVAQKGLIG